VRDCAGLQSWKKCQKTSFQGELLTGKVLQKRLLQRCSPKGFQCGIAKAFRIGKMLEDVFSGRTASREGSSEKNGAELFSCDGRRRPLGFKNCAGRTPFQGELLPGRCVKRLLQSCSPKGFPCWTAKAFRIEKLCRKWRHSLEKVLQAHSGKNFHREAEAARGKGPAAGVRD
jgi:hypothetical protein